MNFFDLEPELLAVLIALPICAVIFGLAFLLGRYWAHICWCLSPVTTEHGRIRYVHASPFTVDWNRFTGEVQVHLHAAGVTFDDGRKIKVYLNNEDYIMLRAGSTGMLTRKGGRFLSFVPDDPKVPAVGK